MVTTLSKEYANKNINIKQSTKEAFDKAKKGKSADEFIAYLLKLHQEAKNIESQIKNLKEENAKLKDEKVNQPQPATSVVIPTTDTPTEPSEITETTAPIEPVKVRGQQCHYYRFNPKKPIAPVECMRKYEKTEEIDRYSQQVCDYCWAQNPYRKYPITNSNVTDKNPSLKGISETSLITDETREKYPQHIPDKIYCEDLTNWVHQDTCERCRNVSPNKFKDCKNVKQFKFTEKPTIEPNRDVFSSKDNQW